MSPLMLRREQEFYPQRNELSQKAWIISSPEAWSGEWTEDLGKTAERPRMRYQRDCRHRAKLSLLRLH